LIETAGEIEGNGEHQVVNEEYRPCERKHLVLVAPMSLTDEPISFEQIKPLFRARDRQSMTWAFDLWSHDDVAGNSEAILEKLSDGTMPCDDTWPDEQIAVFQHWIDAGTPATSAP
jgi:hypothetical protein